MSKIPAAVIAAVKARANGFCEACGGYLGADGGVLHHRKRRSQGGLHDAVNLIEIHWVCHNGHTNSIHSHGTRERSLRLGHLVSAYDDPADHPVVVYPDLLRMRV